MTELQLLQKIQELAIQVKDNGDASYTRMNMQSILEHINFYNQDKQNNIPKAKSDEEPSLSELCKNDVLIALKELNSAYSEKNPCLMKEYIGKALRNIGKVQTKLAIPNRKRALRWN